MMLGVSTPDAVLGGVVALSAAVLVIAVGLLISDLRRERHRKNNARRAWTTVSGELEDDRARAEELLVEADALVGQLRRLEADEEGKKGEAAMPGEPPELRARRVLKEIDALPVARGPAQSAVWNLSVEELPYLSGEEEQAIAVVASLSKAREELARLFPDHAPRG
jgi:hypothetical protein